MSQSVVIIDYGSGNLRSVAKAFERVAREQEFNQRIVVSDDPAVITTASHIVLPGVGAFGHCAANLQARPGVWEALHRRVLEQHIPFLGICVGMQLLATRGIEHGEHAGLDWIAGDVKLLVPEDATLKIPHMGWNEVDIDQTHSLLRAQPAQTYACFVHSYAMHCADPSHVLATTDYGGSIAAIVGRDNIIGTQFHPEKSQHFGLGFLAAFLRWHP